MQISVFIGFLGRKIQNCILTNIPCIFVLNLFEKGNYETDSQFISE